MIVRVRVVGTENWNDYEAISVYVYKSADVVDGNVRVLPKCPLAAILDSDVVDMEFSIEADVDGDVVTLSGVASDGKSFGSGKEYEDPAVDYHFYAQAMVTED